MAAIVVSLLYLFLLLLFARAILGWVMMSGYRPTGVVAVLFEVIYSVTDPVVRPVDRLIPPLRVGNTAISLGFTLIFVVILVVLIPLAARIPF